MNPKRFILALAALAMFAAVMANGASAATMTPAGEWYIGTTAPGTTLTTTKSVECSVGEHEGSSKFVLTGVIGEAPKEIPVKLEATQIDCIEATIFNEEGHGRDAGRLKFTGVTVALPTPGCTVENGEVTTEPLKTELYMDSESTTKAFDKFVPAVAGGNFATVQINGTCAAAGATSRPMPRSATPGSGAPSGNPLARCWTSNGGAITAPPPPALIAIAIEPATQPVLVPKPNA